MTPRARLRSARGSVLVLVAAAIFPIAAILTFTIDVSHWFDYSRNLQNRADAAALAAGTAYGDICFRSAADQGDQWTGLQSVVGKWAQLYSGPGSNEPFDAGTNPAANVPYSDSDVFTATGESAYRNLTNLSLGSLDDYFVRLNADNYADKGGVDFAMGDFCNADPAKDLTDKHPGDPGAMTDVKVTQRQLPNFIPIFNVHPNIEARARVEVQQQQSAKGVRPIAVNDATYIPCVTANFLNNDGAVITSEVLTEDPNTGIWTTAPADAKQVTMPATNPVSVELFLNNCSKTSPTGLRYDYFDDKGKRQQLGLVYINNWGSPPGSPTTPAIASGGVTLVGAAGGPCDPYFQSSAGSCAVGVTAHVDYASPPSGVTYYIRATDGNAVSDPHVNLQKSSGTTWTSSSTFSFGSDSGPHEIHIWWAQLGGKVNGKNCDNASSNPDDAWKNSNKNCQVDLGPQQRSFSGINGTNLCDNPAFDTGPMQWITVGDVPAGSGANAYGGGANPKLYVTASIVGLKRSGDTDAPICLRVAEQTSHATGFVDCGQGNGTPDDQNALQFGCPDPVQINMRVGSDGALTCSPTIDPRDCVPNNPGESPPVLKGLDRLIGSPAPGSCETNYWPYDPNTGTSQLNPSHVISLNDKRAVVMIITSPTDVWNTTGSSSLIPIRQFAVFYVTGWSTGSGVTGCANNDPAPPGAGKGEIWGHWTSVTVPSGLGSSNGKQCDFTRLGNCIAVLTR